MKTENNKKRFGGAPDQGHLRSRLAANLEVLYDSLPAEEEDEASPMWLDHDPEIVPSYHKARVRWGILGLDPVFDTRLNATLWHGRVPWSSDLFALNLEPQF